MIEAMKRRLRRGGWTAVVGWAAAVGLAASCGGEPDRSGGEALVASAHAPEYVASSPEARRVVEEVQATFWIHYEPVLVDPKEGVIQPAPQPALGASSADGFVIEEGALIPRRSGATMEPDAVRTVRLPARADAPFELTHGRTGLSVRAALRGASDVAAEVSGGYVVYPGALEGADVIVRSRGTGIEDYVRFDEAPSESALRYDVELGKDVKALRLVQNTLEFIDRENAPRLRIRSPYLVDVTGERREAVLGVEGCAVDTSGKPPWRRAVTEVGARRCEIVVSWDDEGLSYPILVDPSWTDTLDLNESRFRHGSVTLPDNTVLVAGGLVGAGTTITDSAEIWSPGMNMWTTLDPMIDTRHSFGIALVTDGMDDFVLVAGGIGSCGSPYCNETERYDITNDIWVARDAMGSDRAQFPLVAPTNGSDILAAGGINGSGATNAAERYDVAGDDWSGTGAMSDERYGHRAVALSPFTSSYVLVAGGDDGTNFVSSAERFNPSTGSFSPAGTAFPAFEPTVTLLPSDSAIFVGGQANLGGSLACFSRTRVYNPSLNGWSDGPSLPGSLGTAGLCNHAAAPINGKVLVMGGSTTALGNTGRDDVLLYPPGFGWSTAGPVLNNARWGHTAVTFPSGFISKIMVVGGSDSGSYVDTGEVYNPI